MRPSSSQSGISVGRCERLPRLAISSHTGWMPRRARFTPKNRSPSTSSSTAARKGDTAFVAWLDKTTGEYYRSGQSEKWYEQALADFGLDPKTVPPIMKEMMR